MKIFHFSDSHGCQEQLKIPEADIAVFSGDCSNYYDPTSNLPEVLSFIEWFKNIPIEHKIFVPGNHDASIATNLIPRIDFTNAGIHYLENSRCYIKGVNFYGSPYTPTFNNWYFMKRRDKMYDLWQQIPEDTDVLITHGPPKYILDLSEDRDHNLEQCGDLSLLKRVLQIQPKLHLFGHIHNRESIRNAGTFKLSDCPTIFSNGSIVTDNKFGIISSNGNILSISTRKTTTLFFPL